LPARVAEAAAERGYRVTIVAFEGQSDPSTVGGHEHFWTKLGALEKTLARLHEAGVTHIVMVGPIKRPSFSSLSLDKRARTALMKAGRAVFGDDGLLGGIVKLLEEEEGFKVLGPEQFLTEGQVAGSGLIAGPQPDAAALADIERGLEVARTLGILDVGQAVVVQQGLVLGVEAIEGTDALLERAGKLRRPGPGGVLVKIAKPGQELRTDMPTVGPETLQRAAAAGLRGIALEAGRTLLLEPGEVLRLARETPCFLLGLEPE
jgi:DUF1009 family protein